MVERGVRGAAYHVSRRRNQATGADDVDDNAGLALGHSRHRFARHPDVAEKLQLEVELPIVVGNLLKITGPRAARVVDEDIDAAEFRYRSIDHPSYGRGVGQVSGDCRDALASRCANGRDCLI